jgi:hypothetical protein
MVPSVVELRRRKRNKNKKGKKRKNKVWKLAGIKSRIPISFV